MWRSPFCLSLSQARPVSIDTRRRCWRCREPTAVSNPVDETMMTDRSVEVHLAFGSLVTSLEVPSLKAAVAVSWLVSATDSREGHIASEGNRRHLPPDSPPPLQLLSSKWQRQLWARGADRCMPLDTASVTSAAARKAPRAMAIFPPGQRSATHHRKGELTPLGTTGDILSHRAQFPLALPHQPEFGRLSIGLLIDHRGKMQTRVRAERRQMTARQRQRQRL